MFLSFEIGRTAEILGINAAVPNVRFMKTKFQHANFKKILKFCSYEAFNNLTSTCIYNLIHVVRDLGHPVSDVFDLLIHRGYP